MKQSEIFTQSEGAAWQARNKAKLPPMTDPVMDAINAAGIEPRSALEIGCGDGWRLRNLRTEFACQATGVEPADGLGDGGAIYRGTADRLHDRWSAAFDLVIYGFCLYLVDREDLFRIASEGDRVLKGGGHLVIQDFWPFSPCSRPYGHHPGVTSYKMNYAKLWLGNPAYEIVYNSFNGNGTDTTSVLILKKDIAAAWPLENP